MSEEILEINSRTIESTRETKKRKLVLDATVITVATVALWYNQRNIPREPIEGNDKDTERSMLLRRLYHGSDENCYNQLRLTKQAFFELCNILRERGGLHDTYHITVEESVAMFLLILAHGLKMRVLGGTYIRSIETISRRFGEVLTAIIGLTKEYMKYSHPTNEAVEDDKWKWFPVRSMLVRINSLRTILYTKFDIDHILTGLYWSLRWNTCLSYCSI